MTIIAFDFVTGRIATLDQPAGQATIFTSKLYPIVVTESLQPAAAVREGELWAVVERMTESATLLSGTLRAIVVNGYAGPDELSESTAALLSGELRTLLLFGKFGPDEMAESTAQLLSGTLRVTLIQYLNWRLIDEAVSTDATLLGGTLT